MAFALLIIGIVMIVAAVRDTVNELITLLALDFSGSGNFVYWVIALIVVGSVGYVPKLKPLSDGLLVLIILALFLSKGDPTKNAGGFFKQFTDAIGTTKTAATSAGNSAGVVVGGAASLINSTTGTNWTQIGGQWVALP